MKSPAADAVLAGLPARLALVLVTPGDRAPAATLALAREALAGGVTALLLREPQLERAARDGLARDLRAATREHASLLLVSRDALLASACAADGVHAGWGSPDVAALRAALPGRIVGRSCHWPLEPDDLRADWVLLSPFAPTTRSHPRPLLGAEQARAVLARPGLPPAVALGGLRAQDVPALPEGLVGVAVVRAIADAADPRAAAHTLRAAVDARLAGGTRFGPPVAAGRV
ncbi:MAG TPA: thiamine phosphate synthase [Planctomycetota bacterium]|nr:thiamine phosphate synthase [Planctomycetota bacterium]